MIRLKKINNARVKCVPLPKRQTLRTRGGEMFEEVYANIFLLARKKSGKTTVMYNVLKKCCDKDTRVVIFSATYKKDANMKAIVKYFKKKGNQIETYSSIFEGKLNILDGILDELGDPETDDEEEVKKRPKRPRKIIKVDDEEEEERKKKRKKKYLAPEIVFVFDDLSTELRSPSISRLMKTNRHYKSKVLLSSQYLHDLKPESIRQLDYLLAFKGLTEEKLLKVYVGMDLSFDFPVFERVYKNATEKKFEFLYIDNGNQKLRKNFSCEYDL